MPRGLCVDKVIYQVLADSDSEDDYSPSDDAVQLSSENGSAGVTLRSGT